MTLARVIVPTNWQPIGVLSREKERVSDSLIDRCQLVRSKNVPVVKKKKNVLSYIKDILLN